MRFAYKEEDDYCSCETACCEDVTVAVIDGPGDVRCEKADQEVEYPICKVNESVHVSLEANMATYQFEAVAIPIHLALYREGYNSLTTTQTIGPQVIAKPAMNRHANMIIAYPMPCVRVGSSWSRAK